MKRRIACFLLPLLIYGASAQTPPRKSLRGHVPQLTARPSPSGRYPGTNRLNLAIGLPLRNDAALDEFLRQLQDPASARFHAYLTPQEFTERFGPTVQDYRAVTGFAESNGLKITATHGNRLVLDVEGSVSDIERAFQITLWTYRHPTEPREFVAPDREPSVPAALPVADVGGLSDFGRPRPLVRRAAPPLKPLSGSGPSGRYAGQDFRRAYAPGTALNGAGQSVGLLQFDGYNKADITNYANTAGITPVPALMNVLLNHFNGSAGSGNIEVCLDIEMAMSMAPGLAKIIVYEGNPSFPFFNPASVVSRMANDNLAKQLSSSWTWSGGPNTTVDNAFKQMTAQGQSFFQASGDDDAYTGSQVLDDPGQINSPVGSTNITTVGGTTLTMSGAGTAYSSETTWNWHSFGGQNANTGSGGGVSTYYNIPPWQAGLDMTANLGSATKRNLPDVALTADDVYVVYTANNATASGGVGGTSCAAPLWAGFTALINQQLSITGVSTVGFLNPAIYSLGTNSSYTNCFHDITTGDNVGTGTPGLYPATAGYDLCTGWGTPKGTNLINFLAPKPYIITQPASQTVSGGSTATMSATAGGQPPFGYRWLFNGTNLPASGNVFGTTSNLLTIASVSSNNAGSYKVVVTNFSGAITSSVATLTVVATNVPPSISQQPLSQTNLVGSDVTFSVTASGTAPLHYQWRFNQTNLAGATASAYARSNAQPAHAGSYSVVITNLAGAITSAVATLSLTSPPPVVAFSAAPTNGGAPLTVYFTNLTSGATNFTWDFGDGNTSASANATNIYHRHGSYTVRLTATDPGGQTTLAKTNFIVLSNSPPVIASLSDRTIHAGTTLMFTNSASDPDGDTLTFTLDPGAPAGAGINLLDGRFSWPTQTSDANTTNPITIRVTDNGTPPLSDAKTFNVAVVTAPMIQSISVSNGLATITWSAIADQTYRLQYKADLNDANWNDIPPDVTASGSTASKDDPIDSTSQRYYRVLVQ